MQNGHYISRRFLSVRWNDINCHVQCPKCNIELGGNLEIYTRKLIDEYGQEAIDNLKSIVSRNEKVDNDVIEKIIKKYRKFDKIH